MIINVHQHFIAFIEQSKLDSRILPTHISLYFVLCLIWSNNEFVHCFGISKSNTMKYAKIKSTVIYFKCLRELQLWGFIQYIPTKSASKNSLISINPILYKSFVKFELTESNFNQVQHCTELKNNQVQKLTELNFNQVGSNVKLNFNQDNKQNFSKNNGLTLDNQNKNDFKNKVTELNFNQVNVNNTTLSINNKENINNSINKRERKEKQKIQFEPPTLVQVIEFFISNNSQELDAKKFYYYYESKAWLIGKNITMSNWIAAAHKWILSNISPQIDRTPNDNFKNKDYDTPL